MEILKKLEIRCLSADVTTEINQRVSFGFHEDKVFDMIIGQPEYEMVLWNELTLEEHEEILNEMIYISKENI